MRKILRALGSAAGILILVALILSACLWTVGPFLAIAGAEPFVTIRGRLIGLAALWLATLLALLLVVLARGRRDDKIIEDATRPAEGADDKDPHLTAELGELRQKLRDALKALRKLSGKRLYDMPWYVVIGPPGAGKTTAIVNSRLNFPLEERLGKAAVQGVGGTRNCDWWFTEGAVLIDTAGRYTTQDSDNAYDNAGWRGFLAMLKSHRPRQPVNGAVVAISLGDLATLDEAGRGAHARAIGRRLSELEEVLGLEIPVYLMFTKADLIPGFAETFEGLGKEARGQVWGATLPATDRARDPGWTAFAPEFEALLARLNAGLVARMQAETDPGRRALIAGFPAQLAALGPVARDFLTEMVAAGGGRRKPWLRGFYLTSGTQEGTPIDRLMAGMARTFGIGRQAIGAGRGTGLSFFLTELFRDVIFPEAGLVSADDRVERRYRWSRRLAMTLALVLAVGLGALWARSFTGNRALLDETAIQIGAFRYCVEGVEAAAGTTVSGETPAAVARAQAAGCSGAGLPAGAVSDSDVISVIPALNLAAGLPGQDPGAAIPGGLGWGLYQGDRIGNAAAQSYRAALNRLFLPRILLGLEDRMSRSINDADALYDLLKTYLMLGQIGPMDRDYVEAYLTAQWATEFRTAALDPAREALSLHLAALLSQPMDRIDLNADLVAQAQDVLRAMPMAERVYSGIIASEAARAVPPFRLSDIGGPKLANAMTRPSGARLTEGVAGIYTRKGFHEVFLAEAVNVAARVQAESWVLGASAEDQQSQAALVALSRDVFDLYYGDYARLYDQLLADIDVIPIRDLAGAVEVTQILSGPSSPIANILTSVHEETRLTKAPAAAPPPASDAAGVVAAAGTVAGLQVQRVLGSDSRLFLDEVQRSRPPGPDGQPPLPGSVVEDAFKWLDAQVAAPPGQPSELDGLMTLLAAVYDDLNDLSLAGGLTDLSAGSTALVNFRAAAGRAEGPIRRWAAQIAVGSTELTAGGTRAAISARWQSEVLPTCLRVAGNTYPFQRGSRTDAPIQDFGRLFGPGGLIDGFFQDTLAQFVDVSGPTWRWKTVNGADLGLPESVLTEMQRAAAIRDAFFAGGPAPQLRFQVTPQALDPGAEQVGWEIDGQVVAYAQGQDPRPVAINWPGAVGLSQVVLLRPERNSVNDMRRDGPWAFFRMLDAAAVRPTTAADRVRVTFNIGGRIAIFELQAGSAVNPFTLSSLSRFSCPQSF